MYLTRRDIERFWVKVDQSGECWIWTCGKTKKGYGGFWADGHMYRAHVVAWFMENGPIPEGFVVCHNCPGGDNPACVRTQHLFLGTQAENIKDAYRKGIHKTKFTIDQINAIRDTYGTGKSSLRLLAAEYSTSYTHISAIVNRKIWADF